MARVRQTSKIEKASDADYRRRTCKDLRYVDVGHNVRVAKRARATASVVIRASELDQPTFVVEKLRAADGLLA